MANRFGLNCNAVTVKIWKLQLMGTDCKQSLWIGIIRAESESELFTGDTSKDNHSPGPVFREVSP